MSVKGILVARGFVLPTLPCQASYSVIVSLLWIECAPSTALAIRTAWSI
jgi:hypothetical protein